MKPGKNDGCARTVVRSDPAGTRVADTAHVANFGPFVIPDSTLAEEQVLFLSDILSTGYQAAVNGEVGQGSAVAIFGAGPIGLMAAAWARMLGAKRIFMVDHHQYRLDFAVQTYGVEAINFDATDDPVAVIIDRTDSRGVDASVDAVGFEAKGSTLERALTTLKLEGSREVAAPGDSCYPARRRTGCLRRLHSRFPVRRCVRKRPDVQC